MLMSQEKMAISIPEQQQQPNAQVTILSDQNKTELIKNKIKSISPKLTISLMLCIALFMLFGVLFFFGYHKGATTPIVPISKNQTPLHPTFSQNINPTPTPAPTKPPYDPIIKQQLISELKNIDMFDIIREDSNDFKAIYEYKKTFPKRDMTDVYDYLPIPDDMPDIIEGLRKAVQGYENIQKDPESWKIIQEYQKKFPNEELPFEILSNPSYTAEFIKDLQREMNKVSY